MSRIIASLVEAGYVSRESDPVDRRAWLAKATEEGERLVSGVRSTRVQELNRRLDRLSPEHREALTAAIPALEALIADD
jgi:DNA-binding MarR family transcriptional regulator